MNNPKSFTMINDSNVFQVLVQQVTQSTNVSLPPKIISTLSTSYTTTIQPLQTQETSPRIHDPPHLPSQFSPHTASHNSPQQGSSNPNGTTTDQSQPEVQ